MKIKNIFLNETPLPDDWDSDIFNDRIPFKTRVEYAKQRAQRIGTGSSRIAFEIPYQGRPTILKVAKNRKGMAQNDVEADILTDGYASRLGIVIPVIDYDDRSNQPTWIHTEKAQPISSSNALQRILGFDPTLIIRRVWELNGRNVGYSDYPEDSDIFDAVVDLCMNFNIDPRDFNTHRNWGVYRGRPVIIDVGFNEQVATLYR